jgi:DNA-binding GntR family transcriptional regulator
MIEHAPLRVCMRDRIRDVLVARILDGTYPTGTQLKELPLAREFNVSQAPVREALRELEGSGLVSCERYRGTRVRGADLEEMRESYELRAIMEVRAVELAMPYSDQALDEFKGCLRDMSAAVARGERERYIDEALRFHRALVRGSGNRTFLRLWDSLHWDVRGRIALRHLATQNNGLRPLLALHISLLASLRAHDTAGATRKLRELFARVSAPRRRETRLVRAD